jgi:hypothetical protein
MEFLPNDDLPYHDWLKVAYSLKAGIGEEGWPLFQDWSAKSSKNRPVYTWKTWQGIKRGEIREITAGTVYGWAMDAGWVPEPDIILAGAVERAMADNPAGALIEKIRHQAEEAAVAAYEAPRESPGADVEEPRMGDEAASDHAEKAERALRSRDTAKLAEEVVRGAGGVLGELVDWMTVTSRFPAASACPRGLPDARRRPGGP